MNGENAKIQYKEGGFNWTLNFLGKNNYFFFKLFLKIYKFIETIEKKTILPKITNIGLGWGFGKT